MLLLKFIYDLGGIIKIFWLQLSKEDKIIFLIISTDINNSFLFPIDLRSLILSK